MKNISTLYILAAACLMTGCITQQAYYQNPFHTNASIYKTQPLVRDSAHSAIYASGIWTTGGANFRLRDAVNGFNGSLYRAHSGRYIQGYYGVTGALGVYDVNDYPKQDRDYPDNKNLNDSLINLHSGSKFYAGLGAVGGVNLVIPFGKSEWRAIGVEASWIREYGDYLKFRQALPDTAANLLDRRQKHFTIGFNTDMVFYRRAGAAGYKIALVYTTGKMTQYDSNRKPLRVGSGYLSQTLHFTNRRVTSQFQFNFGDRGLSFLAGVNYRLASH